MGQPIWPGYVGLGFLTWVESFNDTTTEAGQIKALSDFAKYKYPVDTTVLQLRKGLLDSLIFGHLGHHHGQRQGKSGQARQLLQVNSRQVSEAARQATVHTARYLCAQHSPLRRTGSLSTGAEGVLKVGVEDSTGLRPYSK